MSRRAWRAALLLPLMGSLLLLRFVPRVTEAPATRQWLIAWRLDPLSLVFLLSLCFAVAVLPPPNDRIWRQPVRALACLGLIVAGLLAQHLLVLPLALIGVGVALRSWRWLLAAALLTISLGWLRFAGGRTWDAAQTAPLLTAPIFLLLLAGSYAGLGGYPLGLRRERSDPLRLALQPIWLLPLLRAIAWGPWNSGWALAVLLLGGATALWSGTAALWAIADDERIERLAGTWLGMALAASGLLTTVGTISVLWQVLTYGVSLGLLWTRRWRWWAAPLPLSASFVASWLVQGATAASGTALLAAALWLATLFSGIAVFRLPRDPATRSRTATILLGLTLLLGVLVPLPVRYLLNPAVEQLQAGLTPFGLIDVWPWIGLAALDAGQRRVAVLPSIAVAALALVAAALVWLIARLLGSIGADDSDASAETTGMWQTIREQVWWARGAGRRG